MQMNRSPEPPDPPKPARFELKVEGLQANPRVAQGIIHFGLGLFGVVGALARTPTASAIFTPGAPDAFGAALLLGLRASEKSWPRIIPVLKGWWLVLGSKTPSTNPSPCN